MRRAGPELGPLRVGGLLVVRRRRRPCRSSAGPRRSAARSRPRRTAAPRHPAAVPPGSARPGSSYPAGTRELELAGHALAVGGGVALRAGLDVDAGRRRRAGAAARDPGRRRRPSSRCRSRARRATRWTTPEPRRPAGRDRAVHPARGGPHAPATAEYAVARADLDCGGACARTPSAPEPSRVQAGVRRPPGSPAPPSPATRRRRPVRRAARAAPALLARAVLHAAPNGASGSSRSSDPPRVVEHVAAPLRRGRRHAAASSRPCRAATSTPTGTADLVLALDVRGGGIPDARVDVQLLSRAGGLSHDSAEPEKTLLALADRAKAERKGNAGRAARDRAPGAGAARRAVPRVRRRARAPRRRARACRAAPRSRAGRAASVRTARARRAGQAARSDRRLRSTAPPSYRLTDNDWERVRVALAARATARATSSAPGPALAVPSAPRRAALGARVSRRAARCCCAASRRRATTWPAASSTPIGMPGERADHRPERPLRARRDRAQLRGLPPEHRRRRAHRRSAWSRARASPSR